MAKKYYFQPFLIPLFIIINIFSILHSVKYMIYDGNKNSTTTIIAIFQAGLSILQFFQLIFIILLIWLFTLPFLINTGIILFLYFITSIVLIVNIIGQSFIMEKFWKNIVLSPFIFFFIINIIEFIYAWIIFFYEKNEEEDILDQNKKNNVNEIVDQQQQQKSTSLFVLKYPQNKTRNYKMI